MDSNVNLASDFTEYAFNNSATTGTDTTSFGYGAEGFAGSVRKVSNGNMAEQITQPNTTVTTLYDADTVNLNSSTGLGWVKATLTSLKNYLASFFLSVHTSFSVAGIATDTPTNFVQIPAVASDTRTYLVTAYLEDADPNQYGASAFFQGSNYGTRMFGNIDGSGMFITLSTNNVIVRQTTGSTRTVLGKIQRIN